MKKLIVLTMLIVVLLAGCVTASYNPETKEVKYARLGDQTVSGFTAELPDGSKVAFEQQESKAQMFKTALELVKEGIRIGAEK